MSIVALTIPLLMKRIVNLFPDFDNEHFDSSVESIKHHDGYLYIILQVLGAMIVEDTSFYWTHRLFHAFPWLYARVHKFHHSMTAPIAIGAAYASVPDFMQNQFCTALGLIICCKNVYAGILWVILRIYITTEVHSGYKFPWFIDQILGKYFPWLDVWYAGSQHHDKHHEFYKVNYGSTMYFWDWIMGTDERTFRKQKSKVEKAK